MMRWTILYLMRGSGDFANRNLHYDNVIIGAMASQITSLTIVYSIVYSGTDQRKHQSSASLAFVRGIHRGPVNSPHKGPDTRKMFPFDDVITKRQSARESNMVGWTLFFLLSKNTYLRFPVWFCPFFCCTAVGIGKANCNNLYQYAYSRYWNSYLHLIMAATRER